MSIMYCMHPPEHTIHIVLIRSISPCSDVRVAHCWDAHQGSVQDGLPPSGPISQH